MKKTLLPLLLLIATFSVHAQKKWTLKKCVDHALENNITIKQNRLNIATADANIKTAKGNFLPTVGASYSNTLGIGPVINQTTNTRIGSTTSLNGNIGIGTNVNIFNGFSNLNTRKQALLEKEGVELDVASIENDVSLNVVNAYLNVLFAKENLAVAETQYEISKKQIERVQVQFDEGAAPKGDLLNMESTAANDYQNLIAQQNALSIALLQLTQLLQIPNEDFNVEVLDIKDPGKVLFTDNSKSIYEKSLLNWPEIKRAELNIESSDLAIEIAKSSYLPTVSGSYNIGSSYFYDLKNSEFNVGVFNQLDNLLNQSLGVSVSIPIFNGFRNDASVERSKIDKLQADLALENQKLQLQQTIEQAYLDASTAAKTFEAAETSLLAQKEAFKNAQVSYDYGTMTLFDFDQVRNRLVNAESALIRAKYDYVFKTKVLKFYAGENIFE